jgi:type IV secretory pathway VirB10-like protein
MDSSDEENTAMAAMMGFATFGSEPSSRKRKHSPPPSTTDPITGSLLPPPAPSGANNMPLGQPRARPRLPPKQEQEAAASVIQRQQQEQEHEQEEEEGAHPVLAKGLMELTGQDIYLLRKGVRDREGRMVVFLKSFVEEDPWARCKALLGM